MSLYAIGLNHQTAPLAVREQLVFGLDTLSEALRDLFGKQIAKEAAILSTCNRTEIYGFAQHPFQLIKLLCDNSEGTVEDFQQVAYVYKNQEAVSHIFRVGTGLDSQILGDFEIIGQITTPPEVAL